MYDYHKFTNGDFTEDNCETVFIISAFSGIIWDIILNISMLIPIIGGF